jgi:hypothetical protein
VFAIVAAGMLGLAASLFAERLEPRTQYVLAFSWTSVLGGISEVMQVFVERDPSALDYLRNLVGALAALLILASVDRRLGNLGTVRNAGRRHRLRGLAVVLLLSTLAPVASLGEAYRQRDAKFPVLCAFDSVFELRLVQTRATTIRIVHAPEGWEKYRSRRVGKLTFYPSRSRFPGARWYELRRDWGAYRYLELDLFLDGDRDSFIVLRIDDRAAAVEAGDWFSRRFPLHPGPNRLRVPLSDVRDAPKTRKLHLDSIARLILFSVQPVRPVQVYVADLRLTGGDASGEESVRAISGSPP